MKLGIKAGLQHTSIQDLELTNPDMCEVWFDINRLEQYDNLFSKLSSMKIDVGLHFWGVLPDNTWANIAFPDKTLNDASYALMEHTIDVCASHGFSYVNIHPGSRARISLNIKTQTFAIMAPPVPEAIATDNFITHAMKLSEQAKHNGVLLTVETVPIHVKNDYWYGKAQIDVLDVFELGLTAIHKAARAGISIANDFGHTAASFIGADRTNIWQNLRTTTSDLAAQTRLLHLGFVIPPYNGTDFHGDLDHPAVQSTDAIPNASEFCTLLKLFINRPDVWALVEPASDHVKNYFLAQKLLEIARNTP
jgi:hypothetical protein